MLAHLLQHSSAEAVLVCSIVVPPRLRSLWVVVVIFFVRGQVEERGVEIDGHRQPTSIEEIGSLSAKQLQNCTHAGFHWQTALGPAEADPARRARARSGAARRMAAISGERDRGEEKKKKRKKRKKRDNLKEEEAAAKEEGGEGGEEEEESQL